MVRRRRSSGSPIHIRMHLVVQVVAWSDPCRRTTALSGDSGCDRVTEGATEDSSKSRVAICIPDTSITGLVIPSQENFVLSRLLHASWWTLYAAKTSSRERRRLTGSLVHPTFMAIRNANQPQNRPQRPSLRAAISTNSPHSTFLCHPPFMELGLPLQSSIPVACASGLHS